MEKETIVCVKKEVLDVNFGEFEGFKRSSYDELLRLIKNHTVNMVRDDKLENNRNYLQLIPYISICNEVNDTRFTRVLAYNRGSKATEERLRQNWSIGIGGHWKANEDIHECVFREMEEECGDPIRSPELRAKAELDFFGFIFDKSNDVGMVHLGLAFKFYDCPCFTPQGELAQLQTDWLTFKDLKVHSQNNRVENWSKISLSQISGG